MAPRQVKNKAKEFQINIDPLNEKQREYLKAITLNNMVVVLGPAGTGKSYIAATEAARLLSSGMINKIVITRPNVASGPKLGFFSGSMQEKMMHWVMPIVDTLSKHLGASTVTAALKDGRIELAPFETMRGRSFENCFVILDEAQNVSVHEMKMFLTRVGKNAKVILNGDIMQSDLGKESGLSVAIKLATKYKIDVPIVEFGFDDIVRSELCKQWIVAFAKEKL